MESYKEMIDGHIIPELGDILLTKLTTSQIEDYMIKLGEKGLTRTVDYSITILRLALKHAKKKYKLIKENPAAEVDLPPREETEQKAFDGKQMLDILAKAKKIGHQDYRKWVMGFYTGMRRGEIMGLQ